MQELCYLQYINIWVCTVMGMQVRAVHSTMVQGEGAEGGVVCFFVSHITIDFQNLVIVAFILIVWCSV